MAKLTRTQIASCTTKEQLTALHKAYYPYANNGASICWANNILWGRQNKKLKGLGEPKEVRPHWND